MIIKPTIKYIFDNRLSIATFLTVGLLSAFIYFGSFTFFWKMLHLHYSLAVSISYILSIIFHFYANRYFTFKSHGKKFFHHLIKYLTMVSFNYVVTIGMVYFIVEQCRLSPYLGIILSIGTTMNTGYFMSRYWVFYQRI